MGASRSNSRRDLLRSTNVVPLSGPAGGTPSTTPSTPSPTSTEFLTDAELKCLVISDLVAPTRTSTNVDPMHLAYHEALAYVLYLRRLIGRD